MTVYFAIGAGRIKAGYTKGSAIKRLKQISSHLADPLSLMGTIDGDMRIERAAQNALRAFHLKGEWFRDCPEAREIIQSIISGGTILEPIAPKDSPPYVHCDVLPENRRKARNLLLNAIWPGDYLGKLSELFQQPKETVALWLSDEVDMPDYACLALGGLFTPFLSTGKLPGYVEIA